MTFLYVAANTNLSRFVSGIKIVMALDEYENGKVNCWMSAQSPLGPLSSPFKTDPFDRGKRKSSENNWRKSSRILGITSNGQILGIKSKQNIANRHWPCLSYDSWFHTVFRSVVCVSGNIATSHRVPSLLANEPEHTGFRPSCIETME